MRVYIEEELYDLPHPVSSKHHPMARAKRAAQFASFQALNGFEDSIEESGRLTQKKRDLDEGEKAELDRKLQSLIPLLPQRPLICVIYFVKDKYKDGGEYVEYSGNIKKADPALKTLLFCDEKVIPIADVYDIRVLT